MKIYRYLFPSLFFFVLVICFLLFFSEVGLHLIKKSVNTFSGNAVSIGQLKGRLLGDWELENLIVSTPNMDVTVESLDWSWKPGKLIGGKLHLASLMVAGVDVVLKENPAANDNGATTSSELPKSLLPFSLIMERFKLERLKIHDDDGHELFGIDSIYSSLEGNSERLTLEEFNLESPDIGIAFHGSVDAGQDWLINLMGKIRLAGYGFHPLSATFSTLGPLNNPHVELGIHSPASIRAVADVTNLLDNPQWTGKLEAQNVDLSALILYCPQIILSTVEGDLNGDFGNYRGLVEATGTWGDLTDMQLVSRIDGDGLGIDFESLRIDQGDGYGLAKESSISWKELFDWQGRFFFKNFDPSAFIEVLQGKLTAEIVNVGSVNDDGVDASFEILSLDGLLRDQPISATGTVLLTEDDVRTEGIIIRSGEMEGVAHVNRAILTWAKDLNWDGDIRLEAFNPSWLHPQFQGSVNGIFQAMGSFGEKGLQSQLNIQDISGTLRGNELSGGGELNYTDDSLQTSGLILKSGSTEFVVEGRAGDALALDFTLLSPDLTTLIPEGKGSLSLQGSMEGDRKKPKLGIEMKGQGLRFKEKNFGSMQGTIQTELRQGGAVSGEIRGENISLSGLFVDNYAVSVSGKLQDHTIGIDISTPMGKILAQGQGGYTEQWQGQLSQVSLESSDFGVWKQQDETALTAGYSQVLLDGFCLARGEETICVDGSVLFGDRLQWSVEGSLESVELDIVDRLKLTSFPIRGLVNGDISATGDLEHVQSGWANLKFPQIEFMVSIEDTDLVPFHFDDTVLHLNLNDALLNGDLQTRMNNGSEIVLNGEVNNAGNFSLPVQSLPVRGHLDLKEFNLALVAAFTGYGVEPSGLLNSSLSFAGTIGQPIVYGKSSIEKGGITLPFQGVTLENIDLSLEAGETGAKVTCTATSGPGQLTAKGTLLYGKKGVEGELNIQGSDFLLVDLPEYRIRVNPDVLFLFDKDHAKIKGKVEVPYGMITPEEMSDSISSSEDVIFVNGTEEEKKNGWPFSLDLDVLLGEDVRIDGYGLSGRVGGDLSIKTSSDAILTGTGALDLFEGSFSIYSRVLDIERGRVLFTGGPIDNPGVDVRAQVKISDNKAKGKGYTVGVDISGLVQDLQYHLFSDPYMEDTEILSHMIVGHSTASSNKEEGTLLESAAVTLGLKGGSSFVEGLGSILQFDDLHLEGSNRKENVSLVVGKRVTEDLYIGYDMNMFSQLGQFRVRYDLVRGFSVETRSSSQSTGADLLYSFER